MNTKETKRMIAVMQAFVDGKTIQTKETYTAWEDWDIPHEPSWNWDVVDYRIKPELKLRPYKDFEEMAKDAVKHGVVKHRFNCDTFEIEDKNNKRIGTVSLVPDGVVEYHYTDLEDDFISFEEMAEKYNWKDGTPCGVEEEL